MDALYEAIALVVLVALIGFWEWRAALLMMLAIPITLSMTFGMIYLLGIDLQQVSVATLILALGLLVDDPVVAGDAIKRDLSAGDPPIQAAWWGPTKLATAILFATVTNVVAYLPLLLLTGNQGDFLHSLPIVMACALIASRIVSMTFIPLLGYYLLRAPKKEEPTIEQRRAQRLHRLVLPRRQVRHRAPPHGLRRLTAVLRERCLLQPAPEARLLPRRCAVPVVRGRLAPERRRAPDHQRRGPGGRGGDPRGGGAVRQGSPGARQAERRARVGHRLRGWRRPALLVLRVARAAAAQLRPAHREGEGQGHHAAASWGRCRRPSASACPARSSTCSSCRPTRCSIPWRSASSPRRPRPETRPPTRTGAARHRRRR